MSNIFHTIRFMQLLCFYVINQKSQPKETTGKNITQEALEQNHENLLFETIFLLAFSMKNKIRKYFCMFWI